MTILFSNCSTQKQSVKEKELIINVEDSIIKENIIKEYIYTIKIKEEFDSVGKIGVRNIEYKGIDNIKETKDNLVTKTDIKEKEVEVKESKSEPKPLIDNSSLILILCIVAIIMFKK